MTSTLSAAKRKERAKKKGKAMDKEVINNVVLHLTMVR